MGRGRWRREPEVWETGRLPRGIFKPIVGYDDVKYLFKKSIVSRKRTNILLIGPPASAKTIFLLETDRVKNSYYALGGASSRAGLFEVLFVHRPAFLLIDELDKMSRADFSVLLSLMETGIVKEVKYRKTRKMKLKTRVYAACNTKKRIPKEILSRFQFDLHFPKYKKAEFIEISTNVLISREKLHPLLARYTAEKVAEYSRDVRDCLGIARLAKTREEADNLIAVQYKYAGGD